MSSLVITDSFSRTQGSVKQASQASSKNYLNRYVECDPAKLAASHARKEKFWKVAAIVTLVVYTIIVAAAAIVTGLFVPAYLPVALATAITLTPFAYQGYKAMQRWVHQHSSEGQIEKGVAEKLEKIPTEESQVTALLDKMGVPSAKIINTDGLTSFAQLRPAIARYQYWEEKSREWMASSEAKANLARGVNQEEAKEPEKIRDTRLEAMDLLEDSQIAKVRAAFMLQILNNPALHGDENDNTLFSFKILPLNERLLRFFFQDPSQGVLVKMKKDEDKPMSIADLMPLSIAEVSKRMGA